MEHPPRLEQVERYTLCICFLWKHLLPYQHIHLYRCRKGARQASRVSLAAVSEVASARINIDAIKNTHISFVEFKYLSRLHRACWKRPRRCDKWLDQPAHNMATTNLIWIEFHKRISRGYQRFCASANLCCLHGQKLAGRILILNKGRLSSGVLKDCQNIRETAVFRNSYPISETPVCRETPPAAPPAVAFHKAKATTVASSQQGEHYPF